MGMITGERVVPVVNHVASSTLPTPLVPENKYANIYLLSVADQRGCKQKAPLSKRTYPYSYMFSQSETDTFQDCCKIQKPPSQC